MFALRATKQQAAEHYANGGAVLVSENDHHRRIPVTEHTTTHSLQSGMSWEELAEQVAMWRTRYPRQRYYVVVNDPE